MEYIYIKKIIDFTNTKTPCFTQTQESPYFTRSPHKSTLLFNRGLDNSITRSEYRLIVLRMYSCEQRRDVYVRRVECGFGFTVDILIRAH